MDLSPFRKMMSEIRTKLTGHQAEIARLEAERDHLIESQIRFDCWKEKMCESIDAQADAVGARMVDSWANYINGYNNAAVIKWPIQRFGTTEGLLAHSPFSGAPKIDKIPDGGLWHGPLLLLLRDDLKALFLDKIEPLRKSWPKDSECGPPYAKRVTRLAEIEKRIAALIEERDAALGILNEVAGATKAEATNERI